MGDLIWISLGDFICLEVSGRKYMVFRAVLFCFPPAELIVFGVLGTERLEALLNTGIDFYSGCLGDISSSLGEQVMNLLSFVDSGSKFTD